MGLCRPTLDRRGHRPRTRHPPLSRFGSPFPGSGLSLSGTLVLRAFGSASRASGSCTHFQYPRIKYWASRHSQGTHPYQIITALPPANGITSPQPAPAGPSAGLIVRQLHAGIDLGRNPKIVGRDNEVLQSATSRSRKNLKNSIPSRSRRFIISGLRTISPKIEAIFGARK